MFGIPRVSRAFRQGVSLLLGVLVYGISSEALAEPTSSVAGGKAADVRLMWSAPRGCPRADRVSREITRLLVNTEVRSPIVAEMVVVQGHDGYELALTLHSPVVGERSLSHRDCHSAARAAALIVAMAIDPSSVRATRSSTDVSSLDATSNSPSSDDPYELALVGMDEGRLDLQLQGVLGFGVGLERGVASQLAIGARVAAGVQSEFFRVTLEGLLVPRTYHWNTPGDAGLSFRIWGLGLNVCGGTFEQAFALGLCGFGRQHWLTLRSIGLNASLPRVSSVSVMGLGPFSSVRLLPQMSLAAHFELQVPLERPLFRVETDPSLEYQPDSLGWAARLETTVSF